MRTNRIFAEGISGIYKDKDIEVKIGTSWNNSFLLVDGKKIKHVQEIWIKMAIDKPTKIMIKRIAQDLLEEDD